MRGVGKRLSEAERQAVVDLYLGGESSEALAPKFGVSGVAIRKTLHRARVVRRDARECHRTCDLDETVFDAVTPTSAYWVGMLMADGHMGASGKSVNLRLKISDQGHVEKLQRFLKSTHAVRNNKKRTYAALGVKSPRLFVALGAYGVRPNKSLTAEVAPVLAHDRHFWRGLIDGDGCLSDYNRCPGLSLVGSERMIRQFEDFCAPYLDGYPLKTRVCGHSPVWYAGMHGNAAMTMLRVLYSGARVYLDRKKAFADELLSRNKGRVFRTLKKFERPLAAVK